MRAAVLAALALLLPACEQAAEASEPAEAAAAAHTPHAAPAAAPAAETFGGAINPQLSMTDLADLAATPHAYDGRVVKTEGTVARVCQNRGCWMELRDDDSGETIRVPMAGHAFFLPRDCAGRHAVVQGRVLFAELSPEARAHLEGEGATATGGAFSLEALGVELR